MNTPGQQLYDRRVIIKKCKEDFNFFANFCMPDVVIHAFPPFYEHVFLYLVQEFLSLHDPKVIFRFALSLPRGHAKTTFIKIFVAYGIIHDLFSFALIICANEERAQDFLADVHEILASLNVQTVYDNWEMQLVEDNKTTKRGRFLSKKIVLAAVGGGTSFRGLNKDNMRPDLILLDDAQTAECADSDEEARKLLKWIAGTALKARNPERCGVIWIGNMYEPLRNCLLHKFTQSPQWISLVAGGILANGTALWPKLHSVESLLEEYEHDASLGQGHVWFAEIQNDPSMAPNRLLPDGDFPLALENPLVEKIGAFITIDPAGRKKTSDDTVIVAHEVYEEGMIVLTEIDAGIYNPQETIEKAIAMALRIQAPIIFPEGNAYQETLAFWMEKYLIQMGLWEAIQVHPIINSASKLSRIRSLIKVLIEGSTQVWDMRVKAKLLFQALSFKIERSDNRDDILDCCATGETVRAQHMHKCLITNDLSLLIQEAPGQKVARVRAGAHPLQSLVSTRYSN